MDDTDNRMLKITLLKRIAAQPSYSHNLLVSTKFEFGENEDILMLKYLAGCIISCRQVKENLSGVSSSYKSEFYRPFLQPD